MNEKYERKKRNPLHVPMADTIKALEPKEKKKEKAKEDTKTDRTLSGRLTDSALRRRLDSK